MHRLTGKRLGLLAVAGLFATLLSVQPGAAADKKARKKNKPGNVPNKVARQRAPLLSDRVDALIARRLQADKVPASPRASDAEFLRRVSLDLTGIIPTAERTAAFLDSKDPAKRAKLIDELLASPRFGQHLADRWQELLLTRSSDNRRLQSAPFARWLADNFNANKPWNTFVHELLTASGSQNTNAAVTYYFSNATVDKITDNVARNFLGVQLQCAQCHNHPFTGWKQTEYWGMAAFFMKVSIGNVKKAAKKGGVAGVTEVARAVKRGKKKRLPVSAKIVPARFLQGVEPTLRPEQPFRPVLADWLTAPKNPFFARATVNRVWAQLFGRGIVNPVDDMHEGNTPSHPRVLEELTKGFVASGFDVKALYRTLCNSQTYQRTSKPVKGNEDADAALYSHMAIKVFSGEQLFDSLTRVTGVPTSGKGKGGKGGKGKGVKGGKGKGGKPKGKGKRGGPRAVFAAAFRGDDGADPTEYQAGIPQVLRLMNAKQFNTKALVNKLLKDDRTPEEVLEQLYLRTLTRRPTAAEQVKLLAHVRKVGARQAYGDIAWALLNCSEFMLNH